MNSRLLHRVAQSRHRGTRSFSVVLCVFSVCLCVILSSCRSHKPVITVPVETTTIIHERLVEIPMPADSSLITAYFECDSNYNVLLKKFDEQKTAGLATALNLTNNAFTYSVIRVVDTLYLPVRDSIIYKEIPVFVEVPVEKRRATIWEQIQGWLALICVASLFIMIFLGIYRSFK